MKLLSIDHIKIKCKMKNFPEHGLSPHTFVVVVGVVVTEFLCGVIVVCLGWHVFVWKWILKHFYWCEYWGIVNEIDITWCYNL